jgi:hypothetical protein
MPSRQQQALAVPGIGVEGDFADMNPRFSVLAGPGALVTGPSGVYVGRFAWLSQQSLDPDYAAQIVNNFGFGVPDGFVPRSGQQGLITQYLADSSLLIQQGAPLWLAAGGGFLVRNSGTTQALVGQKAYAALNSGLANFAATGSPTTVSFSTTAVIVTNTTADAAISMTGSITNNILTVTAVATGHIYPGTILTGPSGVATGTQVIQQLTSTAAGGALGGTGTYALSIGEQTVASGTVVGTWGQLTVLTGTPVSGGTLTTAGTANGSVVWGQLSPGVWVVSPSTAQATGTAMTENVNVETKWAARSSGGAGELIKISEVSQ